MIKYLYINNFRTFVNFKIEFGSLNVLLGKNGSGKSGVYTVLDMLRNFVGQGMQTDLCFSSASCTRWMDSNIQTFELAVDHEGKEYIYHLEIEYDEKTKAGRVYSENVKLNGNSLLENHKGFVCLYDDNYAKGNEFQVDGSFSGLRFVFQSPGNSLLSEFKLILFSIVVCSPNPYRMQGGSPTEMPLPDGFFSNVGNVFAYMQLARPDVASKVQEYIRDINPSFVQLRMSMEVFGRTMVADYKFRDVEKYFHFEELSDGERVLIALAIIQFGYVKQGMPVVLDEPDNYVALSEIKPWCMEMEKACMEGGQCILISHHPEVMDYFAAGSGIWLKRLASGETVIEDDPFYKSDEEHFMKYSELVAGGYDEI